MSKNDKTVKLCLSNWEALKGEAYQRRMTIKAVLQEILEGKHDLVSTQTWN